MTERELLDIRRRSQGATADNINWKIYDMLHALLQHEADKAREKEAAK